MNKDEIEWNSFMTDESGLLSDDPAMDTDEGDASPVLSDVCEQTGAGESPEPWNNGSSGRGSSDSGSADPGLPSFVGAGTSTPVQGVAGLGLVDGSQIANEAL